MDWSRELNQRKTNVLCKCKSNQISQRRMPNFITASGCQMIYTLTRVSTTEFKILWLYGLVHTAIYLIIWQRNNHICIFLSATPVLNLLPGKPLSLQCVALTYADRRRCGSSGISLTWVDEASVEIQEDTYHQINRQSFCNNTLTVSFHKPGIRRLRCQVTVDGEVQTGAEMWVRSPGLFMTDSNQWTLVC